MAIIIVIGSGVGLYVCRSGVTDGFKVFCGVGVGVCPIGVTVGVGGVVVLLEGLGVADELLVGIAVGVGAGSNVAFGSASVQSLLMPQSLAPDAKGINKKTTNRIVATSFLFCKYYL
jgi:hypothetical protein